MLRRIPSLVIALALAGATLAPAQLPGNLFGSVLDENGEGIPGVTITVTDRESNFHEEFTTDKRGRYKIFVSNSNPKYDFAFAKDGYQPFNMPGIKIIARQNTRMNFDMQSVDAAQTAAMEQAAAAAAGEVDEDLEAKGSYIKVYNQGVAALDAGNVAGAATLFQDVLAKKEDYGPAFGGMARVHWKREEWEPAIAAALRSL